MHTLRELARGGVTPEVRRTISVAAPAVALGVTITPPAGLCWEVMSVSASLVADGNAANRAVTLALGDGSATLWTIAATTAQTTGQTVAYSFIERYPVVAVQGAVGQAAAPLPPTILLPGWTLTLGIGNVQVGDQLGITRVQVMERFFGSTEAEYDLARMIERRADALALALASEVPDT